MTPEMTGVGAGVAATWDGLGAVEGLTFDEVDAGGEAGAPQPASRATSAIPAWRRADEDMATAN
jgi:hypothetical protein